MSLALVAEILKNSCEPINKSGYDNLHKRKQDKHFVSNQDYEVRNIAKELNTSERKIMKIKSIVGDKRDDIINYFNS